MQKNLNIIMLAVGICFVCSCSSQKQVDSKSKVETSGPTSSSEHIFGNDRSFEVVDQNTTGTGNHRYLFYDNNQSIIAENYRWRGDSEWHTIDIDLDGLYEVICNDQFEDGAERVSVYRDRKGVIERGYISEEYICSLLDIEQISLPGNLIEKYDTNTNTFFVVYDDGVGKRVEASIGFSNINYLEFSEFIYL